MPIKKTTKAPTQKQKTAVTAKTEQIGIAAWFFKPDMQQGLSKWFVRSALFLIASFAFILFTGVVGLQSEFVHAGAVPPTFWQTTNIILTLASQRPLTIIAIAVILFAIGMFMFMPRRYLDKTGFAALYIPFTILLLAMTSGFMLISKYERALFADPSIALTALGLVLGLLLIMFTGLVASVVCYARKIGISKTGLLFSFPFGFTIYELFGLFLPTGDKDKVIKIHSEWYRKSIDFLLNVKKGQIILAAVFLLLPFASYSPTTPIITYIPGLTIIAIFAALYFKVGTKWLCDNTKKMPILAIAENAASIAIFHYAFQAIAAAQV